MTDASGTSSGEDDDILSADLGTTMMLIILKIFLAPKPGQVHNRSQHR